MKGKLYNYMWVVQFTRSSAWLVLTNGDKVLYDGNPCVNNNEIEKFILKIIINNETKGEF